MAAAVEQVNLDMERKLSMKEKKRTDNARLLKSSGPQIVQSGEGKVGGEFTLTQNPDFLKRRLDVYDRLMAKQKAEIEAMPQLPIQITLPDGAVKEGLSWKTTPLDVAIGISKGLADQVIVAKVKYAQTVKDPFAVSSVDFDGNEMVDDNGHEGCIAHQGPQFEFWDLTRPLLGDCKLHLLKFDDREGRMVFWHSSAHILGQCLEMDKGSHLTIGPPVEGGFYYDSYMGEHTVPEADFKSIEKTAQRIIKEKQKFERIVMTKDEALELFQDNVFKTQIIQTKIPEGGKLTAYRCGPLIDLCRGPHVAHTGKIKSFAVTRTSSAYWLGKVGNDDLQRVYGVAFPDKGLMKEWKKFQEEAAKRDHRKLGVSNELFFFHPLSPGCAFWLPHGARMHRALIKFMRDQYRARGFDEVITPNVFNMQLWETSGHAKHYKEDMFCLKVEEQEFALKPMNCPSHCLMFDHRTRSYRELPLRIADFGVLHRNEMSGALTGLTRVRRFQQDDGHIFCRQDQMKDEVLGCLKFMKYVYDIFGLKYTLELSTKPAKAMGEHSLWVLAESALAEALNEFIGPENWQEKPGDGAFYGPKIDITVTDALKRQHQCATVQLDFQLPIRFDLSYRTDSEENPYQRPVIIHRAIYGSLERFTAIITEHFAGKFPLWLSPRQILIVNVGQAFLDYAFEVKEFFFSAGFHVDVDSSTKTMNKKIREGQLSHYNYILVVGAQEQESRSVNIRTRDNVVHGTKTLEEALAMLKKAESSFDATS